MTERRPFEEACNVFLDVISEHVLNGFQAGETHITQVVNAALGKIGWTWDEYRAELSARSRQDEV